jgi:hypothetical protein
LEQATETTEGLLQRMEIELVYPVLVRRLKKRYPGNLYSILAQSDRFVITNRGDELRSTISSKAYADLARVRDYYGILGIRRDAAHERSRLLTMPAAPTSSRKTLMKP